MHGDIAVSSNGDVYVSVGDPKAGLQVYGDNGKWKRNVPNAPSDLHGFIIKKEGKQEFIYAVRVGGGELLKLTLDGKTVLKIPGSSIPDEFKKRQRWKTFRPVDWCRCICKWRYLFDRWLFLRSYSPF